MITVKSISVSSLAIIAGCLNEINAGLQFGWSSVMLLKLTDKNSDTFISDNEGFWITVALLIGKLISPLIIKTYVDKIGRKPILLIALVFTAVSWIVMALANKAILYFLSRLLGGFGDGVIINVTLIYFGEISKSHNRGLIIGIMTTMSSFGVLIMTILGHHISTFKISLISLCLAILSFLIFLHVPDSLYYLIITKKYNEAKDSIKKLKPDVDQEIEFTRIFGAIEQQLKNSSKFLDLFTVRLHRKVLFITIGLIAIRQGIGMHSIFFYLEEILRDSTKKGKFAASYGSIIVFSIQAMVSIFCALIVDRAGRRPLLLLSIIGVCIVLFCQSVYFSIHNLTSIDLHSVELVPLISLLFYIISLRLGLSTILFIIILEVFPINIKSIGVCYCDCLSIILGIIITKIFKFTKDVYGMHIPYYLFFMCSVMGVFFIYLFVPETKGKTLEEIQEILNV